MNYIAIEMSNLLNLNITNFIKELHSNGYISNEQDVLNVWETFCSKPGSISKNTKPTTSVNIPVKPVGNSVSSNVNVDLSEIEPIKLTSLKKTELQDLCRKHGVKCSGTKEELIAVLCNKYNGGGGGSNSSGNQEQTVGKNSDKSNQSSTTKPTTEKVPTKPTISKVSAQPSVIKSLLDNKPQQRFSRNKYGNFEHCCDLEQTRLLIDRAANKIYGKQVYDEKGTVLNLSPDDIQLCKKYKLQYSLPNNLAENENVDEDIDELNSNDGKSDEESEGSDNGEDVTDDINEEELVEVSDEDEVEEDDTKEDSGEDVWE